MKKIILITTGIVVTVLIIILKNNIVKTPKISVTSSVDNSQQIAQNPANAASNIKESNIIELESGAFFFTPDTITVKKGEVNIFVKKNQGYHTFVIDELGVKEVVKEGENIKFNAQPGTYQYYCDVPGHKEAGQKGTLIVK